MRAGCRFQRPGLFALGLALLLAADASAQVPYSSTSQASTYVPISGGQNVPLVFDADDGHALLPIGFDFEHYGTTYDYVNVSVNGALNFVTPCALGCGFDEVCSAFGVCTRAPLEPYPYNPPGLPSAQPPNRVIAAFWDDLVFDTLTPPLSSMKYTTLGTAPNRRFVVEWSDLRRLVGSGPGTARASFRIELHEGTDHIVLHYGPAVSGTGSWSGYVGLENATGTEAYAPVSCGDVNPGCDFNALQSLAHRRYEIFVPNLPELAAVLTPPTGGMPGTSFALPFEVSNVGRQDVSSGFTVDAYLSTDLVIDPNDSFIGTVRIEPPIPRGGSTPVTLDAVIPADLPIGVYRLGLVLDTQDEVIEGNETNNVVVHSQSFLVGAELSVRFAALAPMAPGETQPLSIFLLNFGAAQPEVSYEVHLSSDRVLDPQDPLLASGAGAVDSVPETEVLLDVTVPSVPPGRYYAIAEVDLQDLVPEINETNNRVVSSSFLVGPDFRIAVDGPPSAGAGSTETFSITLRNDGSAAPPVAWKLFLATGSSPGPSDLLLHEGLADLTGLQNLSFTVSATIPADALGTYTIMASVDPDDLVEEADESNNLAVLARTILVEGADLWARALRSDLVAFAGQPHAVEIEIRNRGRSPALGFYYSIHLSPNRLITLSDPLLAEIGPVDLAPGEVLQRRWVVDLPASLPRGPYALGLIADWTTVVPEGDEANNVAVFPETDGFITVRDPAPDFAARRVLGPVSAAAGELLTVSRLLENRGNAAGALQYDVYISRSTELDASRRRLGSGSITLEALEQHSGVDVLRAPSDLDPAQYYLVYDLDPNGLVDELDESNNRRASDGAFTLEPGALQIVSTQLPVATLQEPYEVGLGARGGSGRYTWSLVDGRLPAGLSLDPVGILRGRPEALGVSSIRLRVEDGRAGAERDFGLIVAEPTTELVFATRSLPPLWLGRPVQHPLLALGGIQPLRFSVDPALPPGLQLSESGVLSGTPVARHEEVFSFRVEDAAGAISSRLMALNVLTVAESLRFDVSALPDGLLGQDYDAPIIAHAGLPPYSFELIGGALPVGIQIAGGALKGVPSRVERAVFRLAVLDGRGDRATATFVVEIEPSGQVGFLTTSLPVARVGEAYVEADGRAVRIRALSGSGTGTVSHALAAGALPPGLSLEHTGRILGTPERPGLFSFAALAADDTRTQAVRAFGLLVEDPNARDRDGDGAGCGCRHQLGGDSSWWGLGLVLGLGLLLRRRSLGWTVVLLASLWPMVASAQHGYAFEEDGAPYQPRVGGEVVGFTNEDDGQVTLPLPFSFALLGRVHSELTISTNGYLSFEGEGLAYSNDPIPHPRAPNALIAPFWDDLVVSPGSVSVHTEGRAPARVFVVQYGALRRFRSFGASFAMQVHLYEGPAGRFEFRYAAPFGLTETEPFSGSIGLEASGGLQGVVLRDCTPICGPIELAALANRRIRGHGPGALDVLATRIEPPARAVAEVPFPLPLGLRSEHLAGLGPFVYRVYLLDPFELEPSRVVHEGSVQLAPYEEQTLSPLISISSSVSAGRYRLALELDPDGALLEPDRSNNLIVSESELEVGPPQPDLAALEILLSPEALRAGESVSVEARAQNRGQVAATTEWVLSLSSNRVVSDDDRVLARGTLTLEPGETATISATPTIPNEVSGGRYFVGLSLDPEDQLAEENEHNNRRASDRSILVDAGALAITTAVLPGALLGRDYLGFLTASGGDGQYQWRLLSGALPPGLVLLGSSGELRGRAEVAGRFPFVAEVQSGQSVVSRALALEVVELETRLSIVTRNLPLGVVGERYPAADAGPAVITVVGARGATRFELAGDGPEGLTLSEEGELGGTPLQAGDYLLEVVARDEAEEVSRTIPLTIAEPGRLTQLSRVLPDARIDREYRVPLEVYGAIRGSTLTFSILGGPTLLPPGLTLTPSGLLVGVPERTGRWSFVGEVYEQADHTTDFDSGLFFLEVLAPDGFAINPNTLPPARVGQAYEVRFSAVGGRPPFTWRLAGEGRLPAGLLFVVDHRGEAESLVIQGTPRAVPEAPGGVFAFMLEVSDEQGRRAEQPLSLRVLGANEGLDEPGEGCGCRSSSDQGSLFGGLIFALVALFRRRRPGFVG